MILIIDNCSISDFFKYYSFDKDHQKKVFSKLLTFLKDKILCDEIIIIDKVYAEMLRMPKTTEIKEFQREIKHKIIDTDYLVVEVDELTMKYFIEENKKYYKYDDDRIRSALDGYLDRHADLYLIAYSNKLKEEGKKPIIISEESMKSDNKLIEKIPTICKITNENIDYKNIPNILFEIYKDELKFKLNE